MRRNKAGALGDILTIVSWLLTLIFALVAHNLGYSIQVTGIGFLLIMAGFLVLRLSLRKMQHTRINP